MQQAFFSPGPGSCPAWALPTVMTLVRALPCLCLDTLANTSLRTVSKASSTLVESRAEVSRNSSPLFSDRKGNPR